MSDDDPIYDDEPSAPAVDRKVLLIILGGMVGLAVTLSLIQARMKRSRYDTINVTDLPPNADWRTSFQHMADTFAFRMSSSEQRLDELTQAFAQMRMQLATTAQPVPAQSDGNAGPAIPLAAVSMADPADAPANGDTAPPIVERVPPNIETGPSGGDAPRPAAVSLPPE